MKSQEGYPDLTIDHASLVKSLTQFDIPLSSFREIQTDPQGISKYYHAGRIEDVNCYAGFIDEWIEREFEWLESFLKVIKWMEAQGLRVNEE